MADRIKIKNMFTKIEGCGFDRDSGGHGLFEKFIELTPTEAMSGEAIRKCNVATLNV